MTIPNQNIAGQRLKPSDSLEGHRILILVGEYYGEEGICLGRVTGTNRWAVSPDCSTAILELSFEVEFTLLVNLFSAPLQN